jgi:hypothetical protein
MGFYIAPFYFPLEHRLAFFAFKADDEKNFADGGEVS